MDDCLFCKIVKGDIPCYKVYEDKRVLAFLDINPFSRGHVLVLPKEHYENVIDIPSDLYGYLFEVVKKVSVRIKERYNPEGIFINQNNGRRAGQSIFHAHVHIKPFYEDTPVFSEENLRGKLSGEEMDQVVKDLSFIN